MNSVLIKFVENYPSYTNTIVKDAGMCAAVVAVSCKHMENIQGLTPQVWWRILLYSGVDGDLLFITKAELESIHYEKRYAAKTWKTSNEIFTTTHR